MRRGRRRGREGGSPCACAHLHLGVDVAEVVHHAVEVRLARPDHDVLAALLHLRHQQRVRLVQLAQSFEHLRQLGGVQRLRRHLHHRQGVVLQRFEDADVVGRVGRGERPRLHQARLDALDEGPAAGGHLRHLDAVPRLVEPQLRDRPHRAVLLVVEAVRLAEHLHLRPHLQRPRQHAAEGVERLAVGLVIHLRQVDHQQPVGVARGHRAHKRRGERPRVRRLDLRLRGGGGRRQRAHHRVDKPGGRLAEEARHHELEHRLGVEQELFLPHVDAEVGKGGLEVGFRLGDHL